MAFKGFRRRMMVPFDMAVSFIAGQTLAYGAKKQLKENDSKMLNKPFLISFCWMVFIYAPSAMFFYHGWTAWNLMYIFDPDKNNVLTAVCIWLDCTIINLIMVYSFWLGHAWIKRQQEKKLLITIGISLIGLIVFLVATYSRGFSIGSYTEWKNNIAPSFWGHTVMWANAVIAVIDFGSMYLVYRYFSKAKA
jgi:hypothetical protein